MEQNQNQLLGTAQIGTLMRKYSVPCIISLLVGALYNIVDQIFIANASYLGSYGNAANTVVFPLTVVALAIAVMIGDGCCAFVSIWIGKMESESFCSLTLGIPFYMCGQAMNPIIRADGSPKFAMASTLAGAAVNIVLDPIFIFIFKWGMMGAAVATIIGQLVTALLSLWYLLNMKIIKPSGRDLSISISICGRTLLLGLTSFLSQISLVASMAAVNNMIRHYGALDPVFCQEQLAQIPMAVVGIVMKFFQIVISIVVGMAAGCIPVVGFNMGARHNSRVRDLFTKLLVDEAEVDAIAFILV